MKKVLRCFVDNFTDLPAANLHGYQLQPALCRRQKQECFSASVIFLAVNFFQMSFLQYRTVTCALPVTRPCCLGGYFRRRGWAQALSSGLNHPNIPVAHRQTRSVIAHKDFDRCRLSQQSTCQGRGIICTINNRSPSKNSKVR